MRNILFILILLTGFGVIYLNPNKNNPSSPIISQKENVSQATIIAENLDTPWAIAFLPDKSILVTERPGKIRFIDSNGKLNPNPVAELNQVEEVGEGGLMGIVLHPDFSKNNFVYLYYTYSNENGNTLNRVVRMTYENNKLNDEKIIVDKIPGAQNHDGGRIKFGPDRFLYITTGDAQNPSQAQTVGSLAGKILRVTDSGEIPPDNPFNNLVFSYGHRNPQGLAWDSNGKLWATEHGRSGLESGFDEINLIEKGKNYGWPEIAGDQVLPDMMTPVANSGPNTTWAPSGADFFGGSLFFGGLRGEALYEAVIENNQVKEIKEHFKGQYGRIREVILGPDKMLYITTSNRDGRGNPQNSDDKIIKINPGKLN